MRVEEVIMGVKRIFNAFFLFFLLFNLCGCVLLLSGVAGGAGTAAWLSGKLTQEVNIKYSRAIDAVESALADLKMAAEKEVFKKSSSLIKSKYFDGRDVWIDVVHISEKRSRIDIRVGIKGDKDAARRVMDAVLRRCK